MAKIAAILATVQPKAALTSSAMETSFLPTAPTYKAYTPQTFNAHTTGPGEDLGWEWKKGIKSKQLFDQEQEAKAARVQQEYQNAMDVYKTQLNQYNADRTLQFNTDSEQQRRLENQYSALGLVAPMSADDITPQIRQFGEAYMAAQDRGDQQGMIAAHKAAVDLATKTGWINPGQTVESVNSLPNMTSAGLPTYKRRAEEAAAANSIENQPWYMDLARKQAEATLANTLRSAGAPYGSGGSGLTATDVRNLNTSDALNKVKTKIDEAWTKGGGWAGAVDAIPYIIAEIQANKPFYAMGGISADDVVDYVYQTIGGFVKKNGQWMTTAEAAKTADAPISLVENPQ